MQSFKKALCGALRKPCIELRAEPYIELRAEPYAELQAEQRGKIATDKFCD